MLSRAVLIAVIQVMVASGASTDTRKTMILMRTLNRPLGRIGISAFTPGPSVLPIVPPFIGRPPVLGTSLRRRRSASHRASAYTSDRDPLRPHRCRRAIRAGDGRLDSKCLQNAGEVEQHCRPVVSPEEADGEGVLSPRTGITRGNDLVEGP